jgi:hypothetical protein
MMETVTITGLDRIRDPKPTLQGHLILAYFSADVGVFTLKGCAFVRTSKGGLATWLPNLSDAKAKQTRFITLNDEQTRSDMLQAAIRMYRLMGGTDADWRPRDCGTPLTGRDVASLPPHILPPPVRSTIQEAAE